MPHIRKQVRDHIKAELEAPGDVKVSIGRTTAIPAKLSQAINLAWIQEASADSSMDGDQDRQIALRVQATVRGTSDAAEDLLDALCFRVERLFGADPTLGGLIATYEYRGTEFLANGEGENECAIAVLTFLLTAFTKRHTAP